MFSTQQKGTEVSPTFADKASMRFVKVLITKNRYSV